jgi:predicted nucleotidyltransferase
MNQLIRLGLTHQQVDALRELRDRLLADFPVESIILFGSTVRGQQDEESDIDVLILTEHSLPRRERHEITDVVFEINLQHDTNISSLVIDRDSWDTGPVSILPLHDVVVEQGVPL